MRIINWNVKWASPNKPRGAVIFQEIKMRDPEVVCVTEGHKDFFREGYHIFSDADYGYNSLPYKKSYTME